MPTAATISASTLFVTTPVEWLEVSLALLLVGALVVLPFVLVRGDVTSGRKDPGYEEPTPKPTDRPR